MINVDDLSPEQIALGRSFSAAVKAGDAETVLNVHRQFPEIMTIDTGLQPWMCMAAGRPSLAMLQTLHRLGADPNLRGYGGDDGRNALSEAASHGHLDNVRFAHGIGAEIDTSRPTRNPLIGTTHGRSQALAVAKFLLDAGIDATVRCEMAEGVFYDALCFALEQGTRDIASLIALHLADGDRPAAQAELDRGRAALSAANPDANPANIPPPPRLDPPYL